MTATKKSYAIACASAFRDDVLALAARRGVNVGDLARSVMLVAPQAAVAAMADPGEPQAGDRETIILKSGPGAGKPWRRKPRLQVRLPAGHTVPELRRALNLALAMDAGAQKIRVEDGKQPGVVARLGDATVEIDRLRAVIRALSFSPLRDGVKTRTDALYVLGFPPNAKLGAAVIKTRFRSLAAIHHPDSDHGDTRRMSQLNAAMAKMRALGL